MTKTIRYAFNSQKGYDSAKKALDSHKVNYSVGSDHSTLEVQVGNEDNGVLINEIIGRQMAKDGVNGLFTSSMFDYTFSIPRDFGPNDELFANLEALKQVFEGNPNFFHDGFMDCLDSLPKRQKNDLLSTICGVDIYYVDEAWNFQDIYDCMSEESIYPDSAYESMKEFVKQSIAKHFICNFIEIDMYSADCSVKIDFPCVGDLSTALDVIIQNRKRNI